MSWLDDAQRKRDEEKQAVREKQQKADEAREQANKAREQALRDFWVANKQDALRLMDEIADFLNRDSKHREILYFQAVARPIGDYPPGELHHPTYTVKDNENDIESNIEILVTTVRERNGMVNGHTYIRVECRIELSIFPHPCLLWSKYEESDWEHERWSHESANSIEELKPLITKHLI